MILRLYINCPLSEEGLRQAPHQSRTMAAVLRKLTRKGLKGVAHIPIAVTMAGQFGKIDLIMMLEDAAMVQKSSRLSWCGLGLLAMAN